jgi:hypothetical protein
MNLRAKFILSVGLLGLLGVVLGESGAAQADTTSFSFTDNGDGNTAGTVTGTITLPGTGNCTNCMATDVTLTGYPSPFETDLGPPPIDVLSISPYVPFNVFSEVDGEITASDFVADWLSTSQNQGFQLLMSDFQFDGFTFSERQSDGTLIFTSAGVASYTNITTTPEPASMLLFVTGLLGIGLVMRKRLFA